MTIADKIILTDLYKELLALHDEIDAHPLGEQCYVAVVGDVKVTDELAMKEGKLTLAVKRYKGVDGQEHVKRAWRHYKHEYGVSTKYVKRYVGFIQLAHDSPILPIVEKINAIKIAIARLVRGEVVHEDGSRSHSRNYEQKHKFIHDSISGVMTNQLYRKINVVEGNFKSITMYWSQKHVPKRMDKQGAIDYLKSKYDKPEDSHKLKRLSSDVLHSRFDTFAIPKVQHSVAMMSLYDGKKNIKVHSTTPVIVIGSDHRIASNSLPAHEAPVKRDKALQPIMFADIICSETNLHAVIPTKTPKAIDP